MRLLLKGDDVMRQALIIILLLAGLAIPPDPVKTFTPDEAKFAKGSGEGYSTDVNSLCRYECQRREYDPNYCAVVCGD